jgi:solute carrier family 35 protein E1
MPFFTVMLSKVILGDSFGWGIYLSLVPIVGGVLLTTATQVDFNMGGLAAAIMATLFSSIQSIFSKKVMKGIDHLNLLLRTTTMCLAIFLPIWYWHEGHDMVFGDGLKQCVCFSICFCLNHSFLILILTNEGRFGCFFLP